MPVKIYTSVDPWQGFEDAYVAVRKKEGWLMDDQTLISAPNLPRGHRLNKAWAMRRKSLEKLREYIPKESTILDLGCGNGWLSNNLATHRHTVVGVDINMLELQQANRVFNHPNLEFAFADVFSWEPTQSFNIAVVSSAIQYFSSPKKLINRLFLANKSLQKVLISDTPFYASTSKKDAKRRSELYYKNQHALEMNNHYHHHSLEDLGYSYSVLYSPPSKWLNRIMNRPPFPIIEIDRQ